MQDLHFAWMAIYCICLALDSLTGRVVCALMSRSTCFLEVVCGVADVIYRDQGVFDLRDKARLAKVSD